MSFEDLQKLKEKLGTKIYNERVFGKKSKKKNLNEKIRTEFTRENKNRPREMSAKKPVSTLKESVSVKKHVTRDPRFDDLCGTFNEKAFKNSYAFINDLKENDLKTLRNELKKATDLKTENKIKYLIQRLENQLREEKKRKEKEEKKREEKEELLDSIKQGEKPVYKKKCELIKYVLNVGLMYNVTIILFGFFLQLRKKS